MYFSFGCVIEFWIPEMESEFITGKRLVAPRRVSWVEVFSLSVVAHGLVVGLGLVAFLGLNPESPANVETQQKNKGEAICFWDEGSTEKKVNPVREFPSKRIPESNSDLVPFTIQMSPIGLAEKFAPVGGPVPEGRAISMSPGQAPPGAGSWFDSRQLPEKSAWLIDCSLSMGIHSHFAKAHEQLLFSLDQMGPQSKARVWAFAKYPREIAGTGDWSFWTPARRQAAALDLGNTVPAGSTDLATALRVVIATNPDLIQILTDEDQLSERDLVSLRRLQSRQAKPMPRIRVVVKTRPRTETPLQTFCRQAGCSYQVIPASGDLR